MLVLPWVLSGCGSSNKVGSSLQDTLTDTLTIGACLDMTSMLRPQNWSWMSALFYYSWSDKCLWLETFFLRCFKITWQLQGQGDRTWFFVIYFSIRLLLHFLNLVALYMYYTVTNLYHLTSFSREALMAMSSFSRVCAYMGLIDVRARKAHHNLQVWPPPNTGC